MSESRSKTRCEHFCSVGKRFEECALPHLMSGRIDDDDDDDDAHGCHGDMLMDIMATGNSPGVDCKNEASVQ